MQRSYQSLRVQKKNGLAGFTRVTEMKSFERGVPIGAIEVLEMVKVRSSSQDAVFQIGQCEHVGRACKVVIFRLSVVCLQR